MALVVAKPKIIVPGPALKAKIDKVADKIARTDRNMQGPLLLGLLGDVIGLSTALVAVSCVALTTVPMVWALRPAFRS